MVLLIRSKFIGYWYISVLTLINIIIERGGIAHHEKVPFALPKRRSQIKFKHHDFRQGGRKRLLDLDGHFAFLF